MKFKHIIFDLDGTLIKSDPGIINSADYALKQLGITTDKDILYQMIGPPLHYSFTTYFGLSSKDADTAIIKYRERYESIGLYECALYNGIEDMIKKLYQNDKKIYLATSKPLIFAEKILANFNIDKYFTKICGIKIDDYGETKSKVICEALSFINDKEHDKAVMIGDRHYDIKGGFDNNLKTIGVLYGYGNNTELLSAGANYIVKDVIELTSLLLN